MIIIIPVSLASMMNFRCTSHDDPISLIVFDVYSPLLYDFAKDDRIKVKLYESFWKIHARRRNGGGEVLQ